MCSSELFSPGVWHTEVIIVKLDLYFVLQRREYLKPPEAQETESVWSINQDAPPRRLVALGTSTDEL